ncbi:MAG: CPBP family intramembrane metalloprotease [Bacteroidales bacterium]|nr:CPBP family intramembrane metalloprotease [Bacteroidales bacterium]
MDLSDFYNQQSPRGQLFFVAFLMVGFSTVGLLLAYILAIPLFGLSFRELLEILSETPAPDTLSVFRYMQGFQGISYFILPSVFIFLICRQPLVLREKQSSRMLNSLIVALLLVLCANPCINALAAWNGQLHFSGLFEGLGVWMLEKEEKAGLLTRLLLDSASFEIFFVNLIVMALIPAVGEEFLFRGIIQPVFIRWTGKAQWGIWLTAVVFSAIHFQFLGFVPRLLLGVFFGYLFFWTKNLWVPVAAHFLNNAMVVSGQYFLSRGLVSERILTMGAKSEDWGFLMASAVFIILGLSWFIRGQQRRML